MTGSTVDRHSAVSLRLEAARRLGCEVLSLDPETGFLHEIRRGEQSRLLLGAVSPLNDAAAARLAADKFHTATVLAHDGLRVPRGVRCLRPGRFDGFDSHTGLGLAQGLAERHGFPLVVKPNGGSRGRGIEVVRDIEAMVAAIESVWRNDYLALVQCPVAGSDLRIDLLDGDCIFAYRRAPLTLVGDGHRSLAALMEAVDPRFSAHWRQTMLPLEPSWSREVVARGLDEGSVLGKGQVLAFDGVVLNLNRLCVGEEVTPGAPWLSLARRIARRMSLRHLGIDFKIDSLGQDPATAVVIEVNASPSLSNMAMAGHYERVLAVEQRLVEAILAGSRVIEASSAGLEEG